MGLFRRRKLPHIDVEGKPYFITACLDGSISAVGLERIRNRRDELDARDKPADLSEEEWELTKHKLVFKFVDSLLDGEPEVRHFDNENVAKVVVDGFFHFAGERYQLLAFVVMPSHHHWLFLPDPEWCEQLVIRQQKSLRKRTPREVISHSIQSYTATQCNRLLELSGSFWQTETFDHYARDEAEAMKIIDYIENNPVVSGLVETPESYRFSSACYRKQHGIPRGYPLPVR